MRASQARAEAQRLAEIEKAKNKQGILGYIDRLAGFGASAPFLGMGLGKDIYSTGQAIFGNPEGAAESALDADEYYRRGSDLFSKGIQRGTVRRPDSRGVLPTDKIMAELFPFSENIGGEKDLFSYTDPEALEELQSQGMFQYGPQTTGAKPRSFPDGTLDTRFDVEGAGAVTQDMIDNLKRETLESLKTGMPVYPSSSGMLPSPEMARYITNVKNDPKGGDKSLEGAAETLGVTDEELSSMNKEEKEDALQKAFASGVDSYQEALLGKKKTQPKFKDKQEAIDYYKKEFADATGIKIDGKPDTKDAMIAFGLALMQNKAGKKFDVGKMLEATGKAGEKAMPLLTKAKDQAKAEQVAAGKYALDQITAGKSASAALAAEERAFAREVALKQMENDRKIQEALAKGQEIKGGYNDERLKGLEIRMGNTAKGAVFSNPNAALNKINDRLKATNGGIATVDEITKLAQDIINKDYTSLSLVKDRANSILVGFGIADKNLVFGEKGMSDEDNLKALQDSLISRYKKFLTQETGNGISNQDVDRLKALLGQIDLIGNPQGSLIRLEASLSACIKDVSPACAA